MSFDKLNLIEPIQKALQVEGYTIPTPIQKQAIPIILEGKDVLGSAQTGTGKTAAFAIPIIQLLTQNPDFYGGRRKIRTLIVTPTRELAIQIGDSFAAYGKFTDLRHTVIYGGVKQLQQTNAFAKRYGYSGRYARTTTRFNGSGLHKSPKHKVFCSG